MFKVKVETGMLMTLSHFYGIRRLLYTLTAISLVNTSYWLIDHFTVICLVAWPLNASKAGVDIVLRETPLICLC